MQLHVTTCKTPIGKLVAWRTEKGLAQVGFADRREELTRALKRRFGVFEEVPDDTPDVKESFRRYFDGEVDALRELSTDAFGTPLQKRIWASLTKVRGGQTAAYGQLAGRVGTSPRVVGNAMGSNPLCLVVPCHRVVGGDGSLTGYAYGTECKRWLLDHEARHVLVGRRVGHQ